MTRPRCQVLVPEVVVPVGKAVPHVLVVAGVNNKVVLLVLDKCRGTRPGGSSAFRVHGLGFRT